MGRGSRREARERALALLYEAEAKGVTPAEVVAGLPVEPDPYAATLARGAGEQQPDTDAMIRRLARGWRLERMPAIDRAVLRLAGYELRGQPDVPTGVVISEAVELASQYSTDESGRFVNGVLARMADELRGPAPPWPLPLPTLGDGTIVLRPWEPADAEALVQAWRDPEIARWTAVPADPSLVRARRWIAGAPTLREKGLSLDLVISTPQGEVLGEVGLTGLAPDGSAPLGFWTMPAQRGRGVASRAIRLLTAWAHRHGWTLVADVDPDNRPSRHALWRAGYHQDSGDSRRWLSS
jgi:N utilization substance protein B